MLLLYFAVIILYYAINCTSRYLTLREKCPNICIQTSWLPIVFRLPSEFLYSDWIRRFLRIWTLFTQCNLISSEVYKNLIRGGPRATATSKMEHFVIIVNGFVVIVNGFQLLTIITKRSILDIATALDPPVLLIYPILCPRQIVNGLQIGK